MKKLIFIFLLFTITCSGQNLVPNPSFEEYTWDSIPSMCDTACYCIQWNSPTDGSPDYFNKHFDCSVIQYNVPQNYLGYRTPYTGDAYWGLEIIFVDPSWSATKNAREYIQAKLLDSLSRGVKYCVSFYVSLADSANYATDGIAAYFSNKAVTHFGTSTQYLDTLNYNPQVFNPHGNVITDTKNWILISGSFIAQGGEQYITIGNFWDDANTDTLFVGGGYRGSAPASYLYIDDVSVSADTSTCLSTAIDEVSNKEDLITVFPNPATNTITIEFPKAVVSNIAIYNLLGEEVFSTTNNKLETTNNIDVSALPGGVYIVEVKSPQVYKVGKFVKE
jgi:hypothetical protein